jgi:hypothetical protein
MVSACGTDHFTGWSVRTSQVFRLPFPEANLQPPVFWRLYYNLDVAPGKAKLLRYGDGWMKGARIAQGMRELGPARIKFNQ